MKMIKIICTALLLNFFILATAQNDIDRVKSISDKITAKCDGPKWGQDSVKTATNYSLYREFKKQGDNQEELSNKLKYYKDAAIGWRYVFLNAPKIRQTTMLDGVDFMEAQIENTTDEEAIKLFEDTILALYDIRAHCFENTADLSMRKAFAWYKYRNEDDNIEHIFNLFNETVNKFDNEEGTSSNEISSAFLPPWLIMAIKADKKANTINEEEVFDVYDKISEIADYNMINGNDAGKYKGVADKCYEYLDKYNYLDPAMISKRANELYNSKPKDQATITKVYKMLKTAKLYDDPIFFPVAEKLFTFKPNTSLALFLAKRSAESKNYSGAIDYIQKANEIETDKTTKAKNLLMIAQYYQMKGDYSSARNYANRAAEARPGWGEPYILIGRLYAASGSKCGSGTGWDSQSVVWAAMDMWNKAKSIDPSVSGEAQNLINKYWQYMPTKADIFMQPDVSVGQSYSIGCWIGTTTTIRARD